MSMFGCEVYSSGKTLETSIERRIADLTKVAIAHGFITVGGWSGAVHGQKEHGIRVDFVKSLPPPLGFYTLRIQVLSDDPHGYSWELNKELSAHERRSLGDMNKFLSSVPQLIENDKSI